MIVLTQLAKSFRALTVILALSCTAFTYGQPGTSELYVHHNEDGVHLRWKAPLDRAYDGFVVERRAGGGSWLRLTETPLQRVKSVAKIRNIMGYEADAFLGFFDPKLQTISDKDLQSVMGDPGIAGFLGLFAIKAPSMAAVLAERYTDTALETGASFEYQVLLLSASGETLWAQSPGIEHGQLTQLPSPTQLQGEAGDAIADFSWQVDSKLSKDGRSVGFQLYRALAPYGPFEVANIEPIVPLLFNGVAPNSLYIDVGLTNGTTYWYYLRGVDVLGFTSGPSNMVEVTPGDHTPPAAPLLTDARQLGDGVFIEWSANTEEDLAGYRVYRTENLEEKFSQIWPAQNQARKRMTYRAVEVPEGTSFWYQVVAVDQSDNESDPSAIVNINRPDLTPPAAPVNLRAEAGDDGIALQWDPNTEQDLAGYYVKRTTRVVADDAGESVKGDFFAAHSSVIKEATYFDSVEKTSQARYAYHVIAADQVGNEGPPSEAVIASMPDIVPPDNPLSESISQTQDTVTYQWLSPLDKDVAGYRVYRAENNNEYALIQQIDDPVTTTIEDQPPQTGARYHYRVTAIDEVPNESEPATAMQIVYLDLAGPKPPKLSGQQEGQAIALNWKWPQDNEPVSYAVLFRQSVSQKSEAQFLSELARGKSTYTDRAVETGESYAYFIQAIDKKDNLGNRSNTITVTVEDE